MEKLPAFRSIGERLGVRYASVGSKTAPRTYFESQVDPYLKSILWNDATLSHDMRVFWMTAHKFDKTMPSGELTRLLEWVYRLDCLSPMQVVSAMHKAMLKKNGKGVK